LYRVGACVMKQENIDVYGQSTVIVSENDGWGGNFWLEVWLSLNSKLHDGSAIACPVSPEMATTKEEDRGGVTLLTFAKPTNKQPSICCNLA
jgi:hypothetical protein